MKRYSEKKKMFLVISLVASIVFMRYPGDISAEEEKLKVYEGLATETKEELQEVKKLILESREGAPPGENEEISEKAILEEALLSEEVFIEDLEEKLVQLIIMETDEKAKGVLKAKLKELRNLKHELKKEDMMAEGDVRLQLLKRREEVLGDERWKGEASQIEKAYAEVLPMEVPRRLEQFGYDIFPEVEIRALQEEEEVEDERTSGVEKLTELLAIGQLSQFRETLGGVGSKLSLDESITTGYKGRYSSRFFMSKAVGPDYILGPGDVLQLRMWGAIEGVSELEVDDEGKIILPRKGPIYVWGKKLSEAKDLINKYIAESYSNVQSEVSMGRIRGVQIFVLGDVNFPGAHMLTLQNTAFHALYAAGGPKKTGSLRSVKLMRGDGSTIDIDLYKLLLDGDKSQDLKLLAGDVIFIPPIGNVVGVAGNIKRPAIYEVKNPLKVSELLELSGGLMPMGYGKRLQIERIERHTRKVVVDLKFDNFSELEDSSSNIILQDGDLVLVFSVAPQKDNIVKISGAVRMPGEYELKPDMKLKDLIEAAEGLKREAYLKRGEISRFKNGIAEEILVFDIRALLEGEETQNIRLQEFDEVTIYEKGDVLTKGEVKIDGAVYKPGAYPLSENMKVSDLLFLAGGLRPSASFKSAELFKIVLGQPPQVINIDLKPIINQQKGAHDLLLQDGDHLFVREAVEWVEKRTITLSGEVKFPGVYAVRKGEGLSSVIERAGGFTEDAFLQGAVFTRKSVKEAEKKARERFIKMQERRLLEEEAGLSGRLVYSEEEREARSRSIEYRKELLNHLAETDVPGRLLINLAQTGGFKGTRYDILIEDGDKLYIPQYASSVQILGGVYNPSSVTYQTGRGIEHYLEKVGGLSENADKNRIYIVKANGETRSRFTRAMIVGRGDTIVVPESFKYTIPPGVIFKDTLTTLTQLLTTAAIVEAVTND